MKLKKVKAEDIFNRLLNAKEEAMVKRLQAMKDSEIDYSDIPKFTGEQLAQFRRATELRMKAKRKT